MAATGWSVSTYGAWLYNKTQTAKPALRLAEADLPVNRNKESAGDLALARTDCPVPFLLQRPAVLLIPPVTSDYAHNAAARLLGASSLQFLGTLFILYGWLRS